MVSFAYRSSAISRYAARSGAILASFILLTASPAYGEQALYGLDTRTANPTCVAPALPVVATGTIAQPAFPNLTFRTVPHNTHNQFRNGVIDMAQVPGDNDYWYVVERAGKVHRVQNTDTATSFTTALDITANFSGIRMFEQWGINSIAFHPDFANNGELYVLFNTNRGFGAVYDATLARYTSYDGGLTFDSSTEEILLIESDNNVFHYFGSLAFGHDGYIYASLGSPDRSDGQDISNLQGTVLRLDVDAPFPYGIPPDNPLVGRAGQDEIFAWGFRNPWRFSIDQLTGDLWLGDVGDNLAEEINLVTLGGNYGWDISEGNACSGATCNSVKLPEMIYPHSDGQAIVGGYVYRGTAIPELTSRYIFGDAVNGQKIWAATYNAAGDMTGKEVVLGNIRTTGFAEGNDGELFALDLVSASVYRLLPATAGNPPTAQIPTVLSQTGCVDPANPREPQGGLIPFDINAPLWSDGATKRRWIALPDDTTIDVNADGDFVFPPGTVLVKEFSFNDTPVETRLMMRHPNGTWTGYSYEWSADLSDATLVAEQGKTKTLDDGLAWTYPSRSQCMQCHTAAANFALGPEVAQLNKSFEYPASGDIANQLATLDHIGAFDSPLALAAEQLPRLANIADTTRPVASRVRGYLHSNCSGCHRPGGTLQADIDWRWQTAMDATNTCNAVPQHGDLGVSGARLVFPGSPSQSVVSLRTHTLDSYRMPPLGTVVEDTAATALIDAWIANPAVCANVTDSDADGVADNLDNCVTVANAGQLDSDGDGYGNLCDTDLNNDCQTNATDLGLLKQSMFAIGPNAADFDGDRAVNATDLGIMRAGFFSVPGPSALSSACGN